MHRRQRVHATRLSSRGPLLIAAALLAFAAPARADVTIREKTVSSGLGGFGSGVSEHTLVIAGDRSRTDDAYTYTGRFKTLAGGGKARQSVQITRLDRELVWMVEPERKEYSELTFAQMREAMAQGAAAAEAEMDKPENRPAKDVEVDFKVDVRRTGKKEKINGFDAEEFIVTLTAEPKDKTSGEAAGAYTMTMDQWLSTQVPGQDEIAAYYRRFAEKLGMDPTLQRMARGMMGQYAGGLKQMAEKMKEMKGYPVRSTLTMSLGPQLTPEQQAQMEKARADAAKAKAADKQKQDEQSEAEAKERATSSLARGNLGGALGGLLGHKLGKAAEKKAEAGVSAGAEGGPGGGGLTVTTDVLQVSTGASGASFEVPSGFKKVERKQH